MSQLPEKSQILTIASFDGYNLEGRLTLPEGDGDVSKLVILVPGTGPNAYQLRFDHNDSVVDLFDLFIDEFSERGIAFFTYSQRGIRVSNEPPLYYEINMEDYQTYLPLNSVEDISFMIQTLRKNERLKNSEIYLIGGSEGTLISALFADTYPSMVDGLFLFGYMNNNMKDVLIWQVSGGGMVHIFEEYFETDEQGRVSREAFESVPIETLSPQARGIFEISKFEDFDLNGDGYIDEGEMSALLASLFGVDAAALIDAAARGDNEYVKNALSGHGMLITAGWLSQHFSLPTNMEILQRLKLPIYIFQGSLDLNTDVRGVYTVYEKFQELGKTNLEINVFKGHDHSLKLDQYIESGVISEGIQALINAINGA